MRSIWQCWLYWRFHWAQLYQKSNGRRKTFLSRILTPCENAVYKVMHIDREEQMNWKKYLVSVLLFSGIGLIFLFLLQMLAGLSSVESGDARLPIES